jgi:hypothetical protein
MNKHSASSVAVKIILCLAGPLLIPHTAFAQSQGAVPGIEELQAGRVHIEPTFNDKNCTGRGPRLLGALAAGLLPALVDQGISATSTALITASGFDHQRKYVEGQRNSIFYCRMMGAKKDYEGKDVLTSTGETVKEYQFHQRLTGFRLTHIPGRGNTEENQSAFEADISIVPSDDRTAYSYEVTRINYPRPILNPRAFGVVLVLDMKSGNSSSSVVLPVARNSCGRPGNECTSSNLGPESLSEWVTLPAVDSSVSGLRKASNNFSTPVTISAKVWEISDYNRFLKWLGDFFNTNQATLSTAIKGALPPISPEQKALAYQADVNRASALADYLAAEALYSSQVNSNADCPTLVSSWKRMIDASTKAGVIADLNVPNCLGR